MSTTPNKGEETKEKGGADSLNRDVVEAEAVLKPVKKTTRRRRSTKQAAPKEVEPEPEEKQPDNAESGEGVKLTEVKLTEVKLTEVESTEVEPSELEPVIEIGWIPPKHVLVKNNGGGPAVVGPKTLLPGEVGPATWPQFLAAADARRGWLLWSEVGEINFRSDIPA